MPAMAFLPLCILVALSLVRTSLQAKDPINDFCRRWGHQTAKVDGKLYIDGGQIAYNPLASNPNNYTNTWLLYSDLNSSTQDVGMPRQYANLSKNANVPSVSGAVLWADEINKCFYQFGGEYQSNPMDFSFWTYDTLLDKWNETKYKSSANSLQRVSYGAGTQIPELGFGYYYGGWMNNLTTPGWKGSPIATANLIRYDFSTGILTNNTGPDSVGRAEGQMVYLPASDGGLLVYFGGIEDPYRNGTVVGANMSTIRIFDQSSSKWYAQTATGSIPGPRRQFCAAATWPDDHSSFNIYLYGGFGINMTSAYDDAYILSLPSFTWIKAWSADSSAPSYPHGGCTANVINHDQMIIMGGWLLTSPDQCDSPNSQGQHNMNLGYNGAQDSLWDKYEPKLSKYSVPTPVISAIGGGPTGGATATKPATWDAPDLSVYFTRPVTFTARAATREVPQATGTSGGGSKSSNVGAIAGGVVGGVVALAAILALVLFCLRRRKKEHKITPEKQDAVSTPPPVELDTTSPIQELASPNSTKYMSVPQYVDAGMHPTYSRGNSMHSQSPSNEYRNPASPYGHPSHHSTSPGSPPYHSPHSGDFPPQAYQQPGGYSPYSDSPLTHDGQSYIQTSYPNSTSNGVPHQYAYPTSHPNPHPSYPQAPQQQVYYPPPAEPTRTRSRPSYSDHRGSPEGTQYSGDTDTAHYPPSTTTTPAQFYAQPVPVRGPGILSGGTPMHGYGDEGTGTMESHSSRGTSDGRSRPQRGRFVEVGAM